MLNIHPFAFNGRSSNFKNLNHYLFVNLKFSFYHFHLEIIILDGSKVIAEYYFPGFAENCFVNTLFIVAIKIIVIFGYLILSSNHYCYFVTKYFNLSC